MAQQQEAPLPAAGGRSFLTVIRQLLGFPLPGPIGHEEEEHLRAEIISAAVSTEVVEQTGTNNTVTLTFSRAPNDVTEHIKGKGLYADDTSGGFSDVYKCVLDKPGEPRAVVAVKALRIGTSDAKALQSRGKKLRGEVHIWIRLDHPNVLKLYGIADGFAFLPALVSPWVEKGTLTKYLEGPGREISKEERISILIKVGKALHYIHSVPHHVVHGDLTGSNILINGEGQPLISDFGLASILEEYNETSYFKSHRPGSIRWVAPELLGELEKSPQPTIESDAYSYGCVMLHTLSGKVPYSEIRDIGVPYAKVTGVRPQRPTDLPVEAAHWEMIEHCLDNTPGNRPKLPDIIGFFGSEGEYEA
ncbi:kinase-like protein [Paxillus ammoniavirescens]|nr:kinase-like protein [Paxillus ammoniavirescens]